MSHCGKCLTVVLLSITSVAPIAGSQVRPRFTFESQVGITQIRAEGKNLLTGCGFGFIGSQSGADDTRNITTCKAKGQDQMRPFDQKTPIYLHHKLTFRLDDVDPDVIHFTGEIGPSRFDFATVSMPMDANREVFTHFRHSKSTHVEAYANNPRGVRDPNGPGTIIPAGSGVSWGEIISPQFTLRLTVTQSSRPMALFFVDHPDTRNVEFSFGSVRTDDKATVSGNIRVSKTVGIPAVGNPGSQAPSRWTFEAEDLLHQIGRRDGDGWSASIVDAAKRYLAYGPYTLSIPAGRYTADYRLLVDNNVADNLQILTLDVYNANAGKILATQQVRRRMFNAPFAYQNFEVPFSAPANAKLEFRVFYNGSAYVKFEKVSIR
jgi:hypothetical protein